MPQDPLAALLALQQRPMLSATDPSLNRNNARTSMLSKMLGVPGYDETTGQGFRPGEISQSDLESAYGQQQADAAQAENEKAAHAQALAAVAPTIAGKNDLLLGQNALATERAKGENTLAVEKVKAEADKYKADQQAAVGMHKAGTPKLTAAETDLEDKINSVNDIIPALEQQMRGENPTVGTDPNRKTGLLEWLGAKGHGALYKTGLGGTMADESVKQLTGYLEAVLPRLVSSNRLNLRQYNDLKMHVPQVGLADEENWRRVQVVKQILGSLQSGINTTHNINSTPAPPEGFTLDQ